MYAYQNGYRLAQYFSTRRGHPATARNMTEMTTREDMAELKASIAALSAKFDSRKSYISEGIERQMLQITVRLGGIVAAGIAILAAVVKFGA